MQKNKVILSVLLLSLFIFPLVGNVLALEVNPILKISLTTDLFGDKNTHSEVHHFAINNTGSIDLYYLKNTNNNKVFKYTSSTETTIYTGSWVSSDFDEQYALCQYQDEIIVIGFRYEDYTTDYIYPRVKELTLSGTELTKVDGGSTVVSPAWSGFGIYSEIIISNGGNAYWIYQVADVYYCGKYNIGSNTISQLALSVDNTDSNLWYPFFISGTNNIGFVGITATNYGYIIVIDDVSSAITKNTFSIGTIGITDDYPTRIIEDNLIKSGSGTLTGRITILGSPSAGGGLAFYNFYAIDDAWGYEFRQYAPAGYDYTTKGCVWAYHSGADTISLSYYKTLYTSDYLYTATLTYGTDNKIATIGVNVDPTVSDYPVMLNSLWITEFVFNSGISNNFTIAWYKNHGYPDYTAGDYRIEFNTYGATTTNFYSIEGTPVTWTAPPTGEYSIGDVKLFGTYNLSTGYLYYIKQGMLGGNVVIKEIAVAINETFVNATCNHTFALLLYQDDVLKYSANVTTSVNSTAVYSVNPEVVISSGTTRVGIVSFGNNILGDPLGIGWHPENAVTYKLAYTNLSAMSFIFEGDMLTERLAIRFDYIVGTGGYNPPPVSSNGTAITYNGTVSINGTYNSTVNVGGSTLTTPTSEIGTGIKTAFNNWGWGEWGGGLVVWIIMFLGLAITLAKIGSETNGAIDGKSIVLVPLVFATIFTFALGLLEISVFIMFCLTIIIIGAGVIINKIGGKE